MSRENRNRRIDENAPITVLSDNDPERLAVGISQHLERTLRGGAPNSTSEREIQHAIRLALGLEPDLLLERRTVGQTEEWDPSSGNARTIRYGTKGEADLQGLLAPHGRFFALEVKTATGRVTPEQHAWARSRRRFGGFVAVVRSVEDARAALSRARRGESE